MRRTIPPYLTLVALVLAACAGGAPRETEPPPEEPATTTTQVATTTTEASAFPVTVGAANGEVTIPKRPERVASLSATATEMLYAIGAGEQVAITDLHSDYPPEAADTEKVDAFDLNVEAVAALEPDLALLSFDPGEAVASLEALGIPVLFHPAAETLSDTYTQIEQLGVATGHVAEAAALVAEMQAEIAQIVADVPAPEEPLTYYHELDTTYFSVTSETFIGQVYSLLGLWSIADEAKGAGPYPQLSAEFILESDPDFIFLADTRCCGVTAASVAERPGWENLTAVQEGRVVELDDDVASRWGPRVVEFLRTVAGAVEEALQEASA